MLPATRPVTGASVSEWHRKPWIGRHGVQLSGVYLCQAPRGVTSEG